MILTLEQQFTTLASRLHFMHGHTEEFPKCGVTDGEDENVKFEHINDDMVVFSCEHGDLFGIPIELFK